MSQTERPVLTDEYLYELEKYFYELYLIEQYTGKTASEVFSDYTLPELTQVFAYLDWMKSI